MSDPASTPSRVNATKSAGSEPSDTMLARLRAAQLVVEFEDHRAVAVVADRFDLYPATGFWKERGGAGFGYGVTSLIAAAKKASQD